MFTMKPTQLEGQNVSWNLLANSRRNYSYTFIPILYKIRKFPIDFLHSPFPNGSRYDQWFYLNSKFILQKKSVNRGTIVKIVFCFYDNSILWNCAVSVNKTHFNPVSFLSNWMQVKGFKGNRKAHNCVILTPWK